MPAGARARNDTPGGRNAPASSRSRVHLRFLRFTPGIHPNNDVSLANEAVSTLRYPLIVFTHVCQLYLCVSGRPRRLVEGKYARNTGAAVATIRTRPKNCKAEFAKRRFRHARAI